MRYHWSTSPVNKKARHHDAWGKTSLFGSKKTERAKTTLLQSDVFLGSGLWWWKSHIKWTSDILIWSQSGFKLHPGRLTWNLRIHPWKRKIIYQTMIFRFYVNLPGCELVFVSQACDSSWPPGDVTCSEDPRWVLFPLHFQQIPTGIHWWRIIPKLPEMAFFLSW